MDLRWWAVAVLAILIAGAATAAAWLMPVGRVQRQLRPVAHVNRLTRLPEFARVHRIYVISMAVTAGLLAVCFLTAVVAAARPQHFAADDADYEAAHPLDTMICVGQPVTDPTTADVFTYYAQQAKSFTNEQIGVTSTDLRAMPLTRDRVYAEQRLQYFAGLAKIQQELDTGQDVPVDRRLDLATGMEAFARSVNYVDYGQTLEDTLALCMAGFPKFETASDHRRQLVYIGYSTLRSSDDTRPSLYDKSQVLAIAQRGGIQLNAISRADVAETSQEGNDTLRALTENTGGRFSLYNPAGTATAGDDANEILTADLDDISAHPPTAVIAAQGDTQYLDGPQIALTVGVIAVVLLSIALVGLRR
jgi:hypothetical protein